jgi:ABC-type nitrate/sulfonate/bicarbonate transport system substrate-binding protein
VVALSAAKPGEIAQLMVLAYGDYSAMLMAPSSPYRTMADLKGKKVGTAHRQRRLYGLASHDWRQWPDPERLPGR